MENNLASISKSERTINWFQSHPTVQLQCIHCGENLNLKGKSLICQSNHQFDMNKQGYFFLANKAMSNRYDQALFTSRRQIISQSPLYDALHDKLEIILRPYYSDKSLSILDAGSGEGSHLYRLTQTLGTQHSFIGIDLAKAGIHLASDYNGYILSLVADLTKLPFANKQFDVILSILSPANYEEFNRVLKEEGHLVKILPNAAYLKEIRDAMVKLGYLDNNRYENDSVLEVFLQHYPEAKIERVQDTVALNTIQRQALVEMTPLTWRLTDQERQSLLEEMGTNITLDLTILIAN